MHKEILTKEQIDLLPLVHAFSKNFGLVGGTAIALQIGHRRSVDFDLFTLKNFDNARIRKTIKQHGVKIGKTYRDETGQFTFQANNVRFTFFHYPFKLEFFEPWESIIRLPGLETLGAMKAYALGRRAKWKDYVDLYFLIKRFHSIKPIMKKCEKIFKGEFNEKKFREQLAYFDDMDYSEAVIFLPGHEVADSQIKKGLIQFSLEK